MHTHDLSCLRITLCHDLIHHSTVYPNCYPVPLRTHSMERVVTKPVRFVAGAGDLTPFRGMDLGPRISGLICCLLRCHTVWLTFKGVLAYTVELCYDIFAILRSSIFLLSLSSSFPSPPSAPLPSSCSLLLLPPPPLPSSCSLLLLPLLLPLLVRFRGI